MFFQDVMHLCKLFVAFQGLLETMWLSSTSASEQQAAISSLSTLMSIAPGETYTEFEKVTCFFYISISMNVYLLGPLRSYKILTGIRSLWQHLKHLPYRYSHDTLSENDIRVS